MTLWAADVMQNLLRGHNYYRDLENSIIDVTKVLGINNINLYHHDIIMLSPFSSLSNCDHYETGSNLLPCAGMCGLFVLHIRSLSRTGILITHVRITCVYVMCHN